MNEASLKRDLFIQNKIFHPSRLSGFCRTLVNVLIQVAFIEFYLSNYASINSGYDISSMRVNDEGGCKEGAEREVYGRKRGRQRVAGAEDNEETAIDNEKHFCSKPRTL